MRPFVLQTSLIVLAVGLVGCCASSSKSTASSTTKTTATTATVMKSGGSAVLTLTVSANVTCNAKEGSLHFNDGKVETEFWLVGDATTVDEGVARIEPQIVEEFKDFNTEKTMDLMVAGHTARQLIGKGHEADDGDPGDADVIVFKVGDHIFIGCNHGEELTDAGRQELMMIVQTAQKP